MIRNGTEKSCQSGVFTADKLRKDYCDSRLPMWKLVQWHEYMTQEGINSQLRTHSSLSPFVTCTFYKKFPAESCVAVYLKVLSMQLLSHRGTDWLHLPNPKKHQYFFFSLKKRSTMKTVSRRHFLPIKDTASFYTSFCVSILLLIEVCLMREKKPHSLNCSCYCLAQKLFCFKNQSSMMILSKSTVSTEDRTGITYFF